MAEEPNSVQKTTATDKIKKKKGSPLLIAILAIVVIVLVGAYFYLTNEKNNYVKTNNASVRCDMITITSKMTGNILDVKVKQGDFIHKDDVIMALDPISKDSSQIDNSYIRSTIEGTVLKTVGAPGQSIAAGQTVAYMTNDTDSMYIVSNIDEKDITKIKIGQDVDITIDSLGNEKLFGKVVEVGGATLSAFSIVPSASSGTFVKSTQLVPIKIQFIQQYDDLLVGANATVRIHLK